MLPSEPANIDQPHLSIRLLFAITAIVAGYVAIVTGARRLPQIVWILCPLFCLAGYALGIVILAWNISHGVHKKWPTLLLLAGISIFPIHAVIFTVTMNLDRMAIFDPAYSILTLYVVPATAVILSLVITGTCRNLGERGIVGFALSNASVSVFQQFSIFACMSAI